ncbi:MAG: penicillin-binding protein [Odoribacter sp.]
MAIKDDITWRTIVVYIVIMLFGCLILAKACIVMTVEGTKWRKMATANVPIVPVKIKPNRGDICAADGRILATSVPFYELRFDPVAVKKNIFDAKIDSLAYCLSHFFRDGSQAYYRKKLVNARYRKPRPDRYLLLNDRKVNHSDLKEIRQFPIFRLGKNKGGFQAIVNDKRIQPHVNLAVRTIGYLNDQDGAHGGRVGLESAFENQLKGESGEGYKRMLSGTWMIIARKEPVDGQDVVTTIDVDYQDIVQHALKRQLEKSEAGSGSAILMDVKTGDIKAIANMARSKSGAYVESQNFAISGAGEPGSVIKAATMIALLEDGCVSPDDTIDLGKTGKYKFYDRTLSESHEGLGRVTVQQMMEKSSNGIAKLVFDHYKNRPEKFVNRWYAMELDKKTGICLPGETEPYIKYPKGKGWTGITLPWMSIGYELKLTPLQILAFYNAIANDGQRMRPRLVKEIRNRGEVVESFDTEEVGGRICSKKTLNQVKDMLLGVVEKGTAQNICTPKYQIAGKTGTARMAATSGGYGGGRYRASFVGYFPADRPLYSCIVVIDDPRNGYYATTVSAPVFREIADKVYSMAYIQYGKSEYEVDKSLPVCKNGLRQDFKTVFNELDLDLDGVGETRGAEWVMTASNEGENVKLKPRKVTYSTVPNARGMGLRDALFVLENSGLKVGVVGSGMVQRQSIQPGARVRKGSYIQIVLR